MKNEINLLRNDFLSFTRKAIRRLEGIRLSHDRYLELLASWLSDFADAITKQQLVNLPPRHLKTLMGSVCLPAWILGHNPTTKIMVLCLFGATCRENFSRDSLHSVGTVVSGNLPDTD